MLAVIAGLVGYIKQSFLSAQYFSIAYARPLTSQEEQALKIGGLFTECASELCPEMVVLPDGHFTMGGITPDEMPYHPVRIPKRFAVAKFEVTFHQWDTCAAFGGCNGYSPPDLDWRPRPKLPVIYVSWNDAKSYVEWLSGVTRKSYRLLSESEYEYAARAGRETKFPWGAEFLPDHANCDGCTGEWANKRPAPVGTFPANDWGLRDMVGNVWEWVEDCLHTNYGPKLDSAPRDGSPWNTGCVPNFHVTRGGSWNNKSDSLHSGVRSRQIVEDRSSIVGFRIARTLAPLVLGPAEQAKDSSRTQHVK
jgi:formylglycine-generating enzyme required for sulfatase activity